MTLQHVMAFAVTDDHEAQERVWNELSDWQKEDPDTIRDMLTADEITADDRRVKFVTLKAYKKAGGAVRRDLFSEGEDGVFIQDIVLLESLVAKKLEKTAAEVRKQGWKWVEIRSCFDYEEWSACKRRFPEPSPLSPEDQAEFDALTVEQETLCELDDIDDEQQARVDAIAARIEELENSPDRVAARDTRHRRSCGHARNGQRGRYPLRLYQARGRAEASLQNQNGDESRWHDGGSCGRGQIHPARFADRRPDRTALRRAQRRDA